MVNCDESSLVLIHFTLANMHVNVIRYKFDDERVTKEDPSSALDDQFGGDDDVRKLHELLLFLCACFCQLTGLNCVG